VKARILAALIVVLAAGGVGLWHTRPDLVQSGTEVWQADWRQQGQSWLGGLRDKGQAMLERVQDALGLAEHSLSPAEPVTRRIVWATAEGELLSANVPTVAHDEFVNALRQSQSLDRERLTGMAEQRLLRDAEPLLTETAARVPAFVAEIAGSPISAINEGFAALDPHSDDTPATLADKTAHLIGKRYSDLYRQRVLRPEQSLPVLRALAGRVIAAVRTDLIGSCDRYDQAFRTFLRSNVQQAEVLNQDGHWTAYAWKPERASFRSLCQTLRASQADGSLFDETVLRSVGEPTMAVNDLTRELARPAAQVVGDMSISFEKVVTTLSGWGVPASVAKYPAVLWSYGAASPTLLAHLFGPGLSAETQANISSALTSATRDGLVDVLRTLNGTLAAFVDAELLGVASAVAARVDSPRRTP